MNAEFRITPSAALPPRPCERDETRAVMPTVSNHATLRYAERFLGIDLEAARRCMLTPEVVAAINERPTGVIETAYGRLIVNDGSVAAVLPANVPVPHKRPCVDASREGGERRPIVRQQALLRYLEICQGVDVQAVHRAILSERVVQMIQFAQSGFVDTGAMRLVVVDSVVVTLHPRECTEGSVYLSPRGSRNVGPRRLRESGGRRPSALRPKADERAFRREREMAAAAGAVR